MPEPGPEPAAAPAPAALPPQPPVPLDLAKSAQRYGFLDLAVEDWSLGGALARCARKRRDEEERVRRDEPTNELTKRARAWEQAEAEAGARRYMDPCAKKGLAGERVYSPARRPWPRAAPRRAGFLA